MHNLVRTKGAFAHGICLTFGKCCQESCCADRKRRDEPLCEWHGYVVLAQDVAKAVGPATARADQETAAVLSGVAD